MANNAPSFISIERINFIKYVRSTIRIFSLLTMLAVSLPSLGQSYMINGVGEYLEFNETTLIVRLELETPAEEAIDAISVDSNKKLSFRILKDKSPRLWSRIWIQNLSINNPPATITTQTNDLIAMTQAVKGTLTIGDLVEFERIANDLTIMRVNGVEITDFSTPEFFEFLLSAFIGGIPPSSELKAALLSRGNIDSGTNSYFESYTVDVSRRAAISGWVTPIVEEVVEPEPEPEPEPVAATPDTVVEAPQVDVDAPEVTSPAIIEPTPEPVVVATAPEPEPEPEPEPAPVTAPAPAPVEDEDAAIIITAESLLAVQNYQRSVLTKVYQNIEYPAAELRRGREGSLRLAISIGSRGNLVKAEVTQNARYSNFDEAAIEAVEDASPFDPLPAGTLEVPMVLEIPITFRLD